MDKNDLKYYERISNSVRLLGLDMINKANSGHSGIVLGASSFITFLWSNFLKINPLAPSWLNRDRFILSAGHGSALLYSLLYHCGYDISINDLKKFRQLESITPGHPEFDIKHGIDATTGPLGQGVAMGVGMAVAEKKLAYKYNRPGFKIIDHYTYVVCGDGDLMEGISNESASFAGLHKLNKLIIFYDSNDINLDGSTKECFNENILNKFQSMNWNTILVKNGYDFNEIENAIINSKKSDKPTLIEVKTIIGKDSYLENNHKIHGKSLSTEEIQKIRKKLNWNYKPFEIPTDVLNIFKILVKNRGKQEYNKWNEILKEYRNTYPKEFEQLYISLKKDIPSINWPKYKIEDFIATRDSSYDCIQKIYEKLNNFIGGSADLSCSNMTKIEKSDLFSNENVNGDNIQYGVREFSMAAIANGLSLHGGFIPFVSTFLVFSDYLRPALRMSALMKQQVIYVFTHDSIAVGEDGPTHQPIEHISSLRSIPNTYNFRPADAIETVSCWYMALNIKNAPSNLFLSRQKLEITKYTDAKKALKGAYICYKENKKLDLIIMTSGSELKLSINAAKELEQQGIGVRVVSFPSMEIFELQDNEYKKSVLQDNCHRAVVEMGNLQSWYKYINRTDLLYGIETFGKSAKENDILEDYGFTTEKLVVRIKNKFFNTLK